MGANLRRANFDRANLVGVNLARANLTGAYFAGANLAAANLIGTQLVRANLEQANLRGAQLARADMTNALVGATIFGELDLSVAKGLDRVRHLAPSTIGMDAIRETRGEIPEVFLRGAGVAREVMPFISQLRETTTEFYAAFISYGSKDYDFAVRLYTDLQNEGVRVWLAPEDLKTGDVPDLTISAAIRLHDKLMLLLSANSIESDWVEREVKNGLKIEQEQKRTVLYPIALDDSVFRTRQRWAVALKRSREIGGFRGWRNHDAYQKALERLMRALNRVSAAPAPQT